MIWQSVIVFYILIIILLSVSASISGPNPISDFIWYYKLLMTISMPITIILLIINILS